jgi:hypothetical protein
VASLGYFSVNFSSTMGKIIVTGAIGSSPHFGMDSVSFVWLPLKSFATRTGP